jgi:hypothetical protein
VYRHMTGLSTMFTELGNAIILSLGGLYEVVAVLALYSRSATIHTARLVIGGLICR